METYSLGNNRELFTDASKLDSPNAKLTIHKPLDRGVCFRFDAPWEGWGCGYMYIIRDGGKYRMYYVTGGNKDTTGKELNAGHAERRRACFIESDDGINWTRPNLGLYEYYGDYNNNIVFDKYTFFGYTSHEACDKDRNWLDNFCVFLDENPACPPDERYKAVDGAWQSLHAYGSPDGIQWHLLNGGERLPIPGTFDCGNVPLWDAENGVYHLYYRDFHDIPGDDWNAGIRDIRHAVSKDFLHWDTLGMVDFGSAPDIPLYTSTVMRCPRAERFTIGFPVRYVERAEWTPAFDLLPNRENRINRMAESKRHGLAVTDSLFMSSRDGHRFERSRTAYLTPGVFADTNWVYGDCYFSVGATFTPGDRKSAPSELSLYALDNHFQDEKAMRRYTVRPEGFVSLDFGLERQAVLTTPLTFSGKRLSINISSSAVTDGRIALCDENGQELAGYTAADCDEIFGDSYDYPVTWKGSGDVSALAGKTIRVKFIFNDCELYSYKFE